MSLFRTSRSALALLYTSKIPVLLSEKPETVDVFFFFHLFHFYDNIAIIDAIKVATLAIIAYTIWSVSILFSDFLLLVI